MEKDATATHTDAVHQKIPFFSKSAVTTKAGAAAHFKRFWWVHLLVFSCGVLIVALPLVYVGYPNIAQGIVNGAQINLESQSFFNPTPTTVGFNLTANATIHSIFHAHLDEWNATLYNDGSDVPLISFPIPAFKSVSGTQIPVNTTVTIMNEEAFENFTRLGLQSSEITVQLKGRGGLKLGALPHIYVNYDKTVKFAGLNGLQQLVTYNLAINISALGGTAPVNTQGNVSINNVSPLSLQLGDTAFNIFVGGNTSIGNATIPDLTLAPGNNSYPILLKSNVTSITGLLTQPQYQCGILPVTVVGTGASYNGVEIPYWSSAFAANNITTTVDIAPALINANLGSLLKPTCAPS